MSVPQAMTQAVSQSVSQSVSQAVSQAVTQRVVDPQIPTQRTGGRTIAASPRLGRVMGERGMRALIDEWEWQYDGACRSQDPSLFYHADNARGPARRSREAAAKAVCAECPVIEQCRRFALQVREPYGVWGGLSEADREQIIAAGGPRRLRLA